MASKKKQSGIRKKDGIHFVNARPASETERLKAQRLVRAHVGRWISDQTKDRATDVSASASASAPVLEAAPGSISTASTPTPPTTTRHGRGSVSLPTADDSSFTLVSRPSPNATRYAYAPTPRRYPNTYDVRPRPSREWHPSPFPPSHASDSSDSSDDAQSPGHFTEQLAVVPWHEVTRIEPQISGFFDPFGTYPTEFSPDVVDSCETYC